MSLWNHSSLATYGYQLWKQPSLNNNNNDSDGDENVLYIKKAISHLYNSHNTHCLPPKIWHKLWFSFLLCIKAVPREIENNAYAKFWGQIRCILGDVHVANRLRLATQQLCTYTTLFCKFLCRFYTTTTWKCLIKISRLLEDVNKWHQFSFSLPVLWYNPLGFIKFLPEHFAKNLTKWKT